MIFLAAKYKPFNREFKNILLFKVLIFHPIVLILNSFYLRKLLFKIYESSGKIAGSQKGF